jgi:ubiquinone/menaquinone biosynthesis C-methylase UbiE
MGSTIRSLRYAVDSYLERFARMSTHFELRDPLSRRLSSHRRRAQECALARVIEEATKLAPDVVDRDPLAVAAFDRLAASAIEEMRNEEPAEHPVLGALERALYADHPEILDDPNCPEAARTHVLDRLDRLNEVLGSYDSFVALTMPLVDRARARGTSPEVVHDMASGHGGFALALKERLGDAAHVVASDIRGEYLELGLSRARARGLAVDFELRDMLSFHPEVASAVDVFTCTQSVHHFAPGMIARMLGEAARAARTGVLLVDGQRSWASMAVMAPFAMIYGRTYAFVHDTVASVRRMYHEEELALLAAIVPGMPRAARIETGTTSPAHHFVRVHLDPG